MPRLCRCRSLYCRDGRFEVSGATVHSVFRCMPVNETPYADGRVDGKGRSRLAGGN